MSYSDKVQDIFGPMGRAPALSGRFVLLSPPPLEVTWGDRPYRFQVEQESVSKELRLFAVDVKREKDGNYSAYLLATSGKKADFESRMFTEGITSESRPGCGMFRQLVRDGKARAL